MQNLEQLRAASALGPAENLDRSAISKLPALIISNGLLATAAFCIADGGGDNKKDMRRALDATAAHLASLQIIGPRHTNAKGIIDDLSAAGCEVIHLQRATTEALAFLSYLKRFARKNGDREEI